jgi:hypothetical protein
MAQIDTNLNQRSRRPMPTGTSAVPLPTESPELAAQTQFFGKTADIASGFAQQFALRERDNQLTNFEGVATEGYNTFLSERAKDPDASSYLAKYSEFIKSIPTDSFRSPETKRIAENWLKKQGGAWGRQVLGMADQQSKRNTLDAIALAEEQAVRHRNPDEINRAVTRGVKNNTITEDAGSLVLEQVHKDIGLGLVEDEAQEISATEGLDEAVKWVMGQEIDTEDKKKIVSNINFEASQQKLAYERQVEKIEVNYLAKLRKEELSENEVMADLQAGRIDADLYKEYVNYIDAQVEERLEGTKEQDWDTYDELQGMVKEYGDGTRTDERFIRGEISEAVKAMKITSTDGMKLLDRVKRSDDTDDPMNRSDVKRGLGVLTDLESFEVEQAKKGKYLKKEHKGKDEFEVIREIRITYQKEMDEYERWVRGQDKLTDKDIQDKIKAMTELEAEEIALSWFERLMWTKRPQLFGIVGTQEERLAKKKAGIKKEGKEESPYPEYPDAFLEDGIWKVTKDGKKYRIEE